jgi:hypothetical protein
MTLDIAFVFPVILLTKKKSRKTNQKNFLCFLCWIRKEKLCYNRNTRKNEDIFSLISALYIYLYVEIEQGKSNTHTQTNKQKDEETNIK